MIHAQKEYLARYKQGHTTLGCRITHMVGVPLIMASIVAFAMYFIPVLRYSIITLYAAIQMGTLQVAFEVLTRVLPFVISNALTDFHTLPFLHVSIGLFGVGWVLQFLGHIMFEKNSPLFLSNPFNPLSYTTAVLFIAEEFGRLILSPFRRLARPR